MKTPRTFKISPANTTTRRSRRCGPRRPARLRAAAALSALALCISPQAASRALADTAILAPPADAGLASLLERNFTLPLVLGTLPGTASDTDRRNAITAEVARLTALLRSRGYLDARIETSGSGTDDDPLRLIPRPGPLFRLGQIRVEGLPPRLSARIEWLWTSRQGTVALQSTVDRISRGLLYELRQASHAGAALRDPAYALDRQAGLADLTLTVDPGPPMRFGTVLFHGSPRMDDATAQGFVPFRPGDAYSLTAIETLRDALDRTGRFRRIRIEQDTPADAAGVVNLSVRLWDRALLPAEGVQPRVLLFTILVLAMVQAVRMTPHWADRSVRVLMTTPAILLLAGAALEVADRLRSFLAP